MAKNKQSEILVVGIGNELRGDDGIGAYICYCIDKLHLKGVKTLIAQQLDTGLLDEFLQADHIIIADAQVEGESVHFYPVIADQNPVISSSHQMSAALITQMARLVYNKNLSILICAAGGYEFDLKDKLSVRARRNADEAVTTICKWIQENH